MRLNKFLASATGLSRRSADRAIQNGRVSVNGNIATIGQMIDADKDTVQYNGSSVKLPIKTTVLLLNKPCGVVCSRNGQGNKTIYNLIPRQYHDLKPIGRLDKNSSGLILLTDNGDLAYTLSHPKFSKTKIYEATLDKKLSTKDKIKISSIGVLLEDGPSILGLKQLSGDCIDWQISISEGRNRQIRRTFEKLGYKVQKLHRISFGNYQLKNLKSGEFLLDK